MNATTSVKRPCAYVVWVIRGTPARVLLYPSRNLKVGTPGTERDSNETTGIITGVDPTARLWSGAEECEAIAR
jgi:hypothetical protein